MVLKFYKNKFNVVLVLCCFAIMCGTILSDNKVAFALDASIDFVTRDKDNENDVEKEATIYAKKATQEEIRRKISDTRIINFIYLSIEAKDYKNIKVKNNINPMLEDVITTNDEIVEKGTFYYKVNSNGVYTVEISDGENTCEIEVPITIIGEFGQRDTEPPIILSLKYEEGNFILEALDFEPGLYGIFYDNDDMERIVDLSDAGNKATVHQMKDSGGYWIRVYDGDDNYKVVKLTGLEPRISYCYKKGNALKLKVYDSVGLWKITDKEGGEPIQEISGKEIETTISLPSEDVSCIYVYNHANNYSKMELEDYLEEPTIINACKSGKNAVITAKSPVGLLRITEEKFGDSIQQLMGKNITVRFNLSDEEITSVYVYDEFKNIATVELVEDNQKPEVSLEEGEDGYVLMAKDDESGIWKITDANTNNLIKHYIKQEYPETIIEKVADLTDEETTTLRVYDYVGNYTDIAV